MKKGIKRAIWGYVGQILMIIVFLFVTYALYNNERLTNLARTAEAYDTMNIDLMKIYERDESFVKTTNNLDKGTLMVRNPNKKVVETEVYLLVSKDADINNLEFIVNDDVVDTTHYGENSTYYIFEITDCDIDPYTNVYFDTVINAKSSIDVPFSYTFDIKEKFL